MADVDVAAILAKQDALNKFSDMIKKNYPIFTIKKPSTTLKNHRLNKSSKNPQKASKCDTDNNNPKLACIIFSSDTASRLKPIYVRVSAHQSLLWCLETSSNCRVISNSCTVFPYCHVGGFLSYCIV